MKKISRAVFVLALLAACLAAACAYAGTLRASDAPTVKVTLFRR